MFSSLVEVTLGGSTTLWHISHSSHFVSSAELLKVHSAWSSGLLMKILPTLMEPNDYPTAEFHDSGHNPQNLAI